MNTKTTTPAIESGKYTPPYCTATDICSEGVLCSSIEELDKEFEFNPWGNIGE